jgi:3-oxoacyl-[acyl-carrier-protein] synthase-3
MPEKLRAVFAGSGIAVPPKCVDNHMLARIMETDDRWIRERSGIVTRHYADADVGSSDLGAEASRAALDDAGVKGREVDYVVCATMTPDQYFPGSGTLITEKLGLGPVPVLDIRQQCAGYAYGLQVTDALIRAGLARTVLLVGCDVHTSLMPFTPHTWDVLYGDGSQQLDAGEYEFYSRFRHLLVLFGDAAGAMVFQAEEGDGDRGILDSELYGDGSKKDILHVPGVGSAFRPFVDKEMIDRADSVPVMEGRQVFKLAVKRMPKVTRTLLARNDLGLEDVGLLVMHQANLRINEAAQRALKLPDEKVHNNIQTYGNTTSATLPLCFHEARQAGKAPDGALIAFTALGAGLHWGSVLMRM